MAREVISMAEAMVKAHTVLVGSGVTALPGCRIDRFAHNNERVSSLSAGKEDTGFGSLDYGWEPEFGLAVDVGIRFDVRDLERTPPEAFNCELVPVVHIGTSAARRNLAETTVLIQLLRGLTPVVALIEAILSRFQIVPELTAAHLKDREDDKKRQEEMYAVHRTSRPVLGQQPAKKGK